MDRACLVAFAALAVSACSADADKIGAEQTAPSIERQAGMAPELHQAMPELQLPIGQFVLARVADSYGGDASLLLGQLVLSGGCVSVRAGTDTYTLVVSNPDVTWDAARQILRTPRSEIVIGEAVGVGGSAVGSEIAIDYTVRPPTGCAKRAWIANGVDPVTAENSDG